MKTPTVILSRCDSYDPSKILALLRQGMDILEFRPRGRTLIKPNVVFAHPRYSMHAFSEPNVVASAVEALRGAGAGPVTIGESCGMGIPGRMLFKTAGYFRMSRSLNVPVMDFNEHAVRKIPLSLGVVHSHFLAPVALLGAETKVWMPKLKYHITTHITQALKLNIGILTHRERMIGHTDMLHEKIVDLLEAGNPDLVISDAITIGHGFESCAKPAHLGLLLMANDALAADVVAAHILGFDPHEIRHLVIASQRGYGSLELGDIHVLGDIGVKELRERTRNIHSEFSNLQEVDTPIRFYEGCAPESGCICDGGCATSIKGALGVIDAHRPGTLRQARPGAMVTGIFRGDVIHPEDPVILVGDCTRVEGRLKAKRVLRVHGCSAMTRNVMLKMPGAFGLPNPMFDLSSALSFSIHMAARTACQLVNHITER